MVSGAADTLTRKELNVPGGSAAPNYVAAPLDLSNTPDLSITTTTATGTITTPAQTKVYGTNAPALGGIGITTGTVVNTSVTNWNGTVTPINDTGNVTL